MVDLGFASFTTISGRRDGLTVEAGDYYKVDYGGSGDHFIFEHRESGGSFNNYLWKDSWTGSGLLLWYTDHDTGDSDTKNQSLIAADGDPDHHEDMAADVFPGPGNVDDINDDTDPEPNDATGISSSATTNFALANIDSLNATQTRLDIFDNHYTDTPTATVIDDAETRKTKINVTWQTTPSASVHNLYWGTSPNIYPNLDQVSTGYSRVISGLTNGSQYYLKINSSSEFTNIPSDCRSDFDDDDDIDFDDFFDFVDVFGKEEGDTGYEQKFDLQGNREVDYPDTVFFNSDFGKDCGDIPKMMTTGGSIASGKNRDAAYDLTVAKRGSQADVNVDVGNLSELNGFGAVLHYDQSTLAFKGASSVGGLFSVRGDESILSLAKMTEPGRVVVAAALRRGHRSVGGSGDIATLHFDVVGESRGEAPEVIVRGLVLVDSERGSDWIVSEVPPTRTSTDNQLTIGVTPNPGNPGTVIQFRIPEATPVELAVFDLIGQKVRTLLSGDFKAAGAHSIGWDALDDQGKTIGSGVYLVQLKSQQGLATQKITIVK